MLKIGFIGAGKMAQALAKGFIAAGLTKGEYIAASSAPQDQPCIDAFRELGAFASFDNKAVVQKSDIVMIAVKPHVVPITLDDVKSVVTPKHLFLSVAMGVTINEIEKRLPQGTRVVRVMPNTPCMVREGASVYVAGTAATAEDGQITKKLLEAVGSCEEAIEHYLDPVTALSGSGPAYIYVIIEALADGGVKMGLPRDLAYKLAAQTVVGAGKMVLETKMHPGKLKDDVTSPAGSTASGLHFLEKSSFRAALIGAIEAATLRCIEQSKKSNSSEKISVNVSPIGAEKDMLMTHFSNPVKHKSHVYEGSITGEEASRNWIENKGYHMAFKFGSTLGNYISFWGECFDDEGLRHLKKNQSTFESND